MSAGKPIVRVEKIYPKNNGAIRAFVDLCFLEAFIVKGIRVVQGKHGLFITMPREQGRDGKWYDTFFPKDKAMMEVLSNLILESYHNGPPEEKEKKTTMKSIINEAVENIKGGG